MKLRRNPAVLWSGLFDNDDMLTQSGPMCDVCGHYILPMPEESVNFFGVQQLPGQQLCCHNKCKQAILDCNGDWQKLPDGPLRKGYEEAAVKLSNEKGQR